jgi:signal transduction histidine kinase
MLIYFLIGVLLITVITLNILTLKKETVSTSTKLAYTLTSLSLLFWQIILIYSSSIQDYPFFHRLTFFFALWLVEGWKMLSIYYPNRQAIKKEKLSLWIGLLISAISSILLLATNNIISRYDMLTGEVFFTKLQYVFFGFIIFEIILLIAKFYKRFREERESRLYFKYIFYATALYGGLGIIFNLILPLLGYQDYSIIGSLVGLVPIIAIFYTIYSPRVFSTRFIKGKFYHLLLTSILMFSMLLVFYFIIAPISSDSLTLETLLIIIISSITLTIIFQNSNNLLNKLLEKYFLEETYRYENIQKEFLDNLKGNLNFQEISQSFEKFLNLRMLIDKTNLILIERGRIVFSKNPSDTDTIKNNYKKIQDFSNKEISIISDNQIKEILGNNHYKTMITIKDNASISTVILLGEKRNKEPLTSEEVILLETFGRILNLTISRAKLFQEIEDLNNSLQQKVSEQTKELQQKVKQLEEARRKEADMIDIMGHELRTPMSIVKLNTDLLHNFTHNVPKKKEDFKKYVRRIKDAVDTEIKLINTLLSSAKLEGNKIELNPEKVNIIDQIKMSIHAQESRAKRKGIELKTEFNTTTQYIFADHARTVEVLNNLIDNAVKYTQQGMVEVKTEDTEEYIKVSVQDTGPGMSEEDIKNLGKKFFRTQNYTKSKYSDDIDIVRPGGTGLGLYVTFSLIKKMGGEIQVDSKVGEGTTFTFTLPKYNGQETKKSDDSKDMFSRLGLRE